MSLLDVSGLSVRFGATEAVATAVDDSTLRNGIEIVDQANRRGELLATVISSNSFAIA